MRTKTRLMFLVGLICACLYCLHRAMFYAWLTATPIDVEALEAVQYRAYTYFGFALLAMMLIGVLALGFVKKRAERG